MATHDYVIANGTGQAVRSDLNNALAAIVSNNSSSSEPGTRYAYQFWADTNANVLKIRNAANDGWITLRELDGTMLIEDGSASTPGIAFAEDINTGIFRPAADKIAFATGGAERVEIGTDEVVINDPSNDVDFRVESNGQTHMLFVDAGNDRVGISTSAPRALVDFGSGSGDGTLSQTVSEYQAVFEAPQGTGDIGRNIAFATTTTGISAAINATDEGGSSATGIAFATGTAGSISERARIDQNGNLGLGGTPTNYSDYKTLSIFGAANTGAGFIEFNDTSGNADAAIFADGGNLFINADYDATSADSTIRFRVDGSSEKMRINSSGQVGINTTSFSANIHDHKFQAAGNARFGSILTAGRSGGDYDGIGYNVGWQSSTSAYKYVATDYSAFIKFGANGRVETFTAASGTAGNAISFSTGPYVAQGGTSWTSSSDERLKTNLSPIENGLAKVGTLRAVTGRFLTDEESTSRAFLIAQDVQAVLPEAVDTVDPESLGLDYPAMIPLLVAALKEAKDKIETLETKVAALEAG